MATHEIIIRRDPSVANTDGTSPPPTRGVATQRGSSAAPQNNIAGLAQSAVAKVATQTVQSVAQVYMANKTNEVNVLTGSTQYAQRQAAVQSVVSAGINIVGGGIQGGSIMAALGMSGGTAGLIGLGVSAALAAITWTTNYVKTKNQIETNYQAEEQSLDYMRSRAGPWYNGSR